MCEVERRGKRRKRGESDGLACRYCGKENEEQIVECGCGIYIYILEASVGVSVLTEGVPTSCMRNEKSYGRRDNNDCISSPSQI